MIKKKLILGILIMLSLINPLISESPHITPVGYLIYDDVVEIWNEEGTYYFNKSSGIQWTQDKDNYWTKNIFCIGYYSGGTWNKIKCADELGTFERVIETDNLTYVNATLWKDFNYGGYDMRLAVRYNLELGDDELSVIIFGKNLDVDDIPFELGFAWKVTEVDIPDTDANEVTINGTEYGTDEIIDVIFKNMSARYMNETDVPLPYFRIDGDNGFIRIDWNENLDYAVKMYGDGNEENFYTMLLINAGLFNSGVEKSTTIRWKDPEGDYTTLHWDYGFLNGDPYSMATDNITIWILDFDCNVYEFYMNGTYANNTFDLSGAGGQCVGIELTPDYIYIASRVTDVVARFLRNGTYDDWNFTTLPAVDVSGGLDYYNGYYYMTDSADEYIHYLNGSGTYISNWSANASCGTLSDLTIYYGNLTYACYNDDEFYKTDIAGSQINKWLATGVNVVPTGITTNGTWIWASDWSTDEVYIYEGVDYYTPPSSPPPNPSTILFIYPNVTLESPYIKLGERLVFP